MKPNHTSFAVAALAAVRNVVKDRSPVGKNNGDVKRPDETDDWSRFEGEGGPEAPVPTMELVHVPLETFCGDRAGRRIK